MSVWPFRLSGLSAHVLRLRTPSGSSLDDLVSTGWSGEVGELKSNTAVEAAAVASVRFMLGLPRLCAKRSNLFQESLLLYTSVAGHLKKWELEHHRPPLSIAFSSRHFLLLNYRMHLI